MQTRNTKKELNEIKKGIVLGLLLTSFYGIGAYIYKTKIRLDTQNLKNRQHTETDYHKSKFVGKSLGYEKRFSKTSSQEELDKGLKTEYCNAVKEIKKVDQKIVPGTNIPFKEATNIQIENAYKEYLQRIAQIRQIFFIIQLDDETKFEQRIGCQYKGTKWNTENRRFMAGSFTTTEINDYYDKKH